MLLMTWRVLISISPYRLHFPPAAASTVLVAAHSSFPVASAPAAAIAPTPHAHLRIQLPPDAPTAAAAIVILKPAAAAEQ